MIRVNLRDDSQEFVEAEAPKLGLRYSATSTLEQNTIAFLNALRWPDEKGQYALPLSAP